MPPRKIASVDTMQEKQHTYIDNMCRWKKAIQQEFYFEAVMIDYATLEDRLRSFMYHIGMLTERNATKVGSRLVRPDALRLLSEYRNRAQTQLKVDTISGKMDLIHATLKWAAETEGVSKDAIWLKALKEQYEGSFDVSDVINTLNRIRSWCDLRNEVVHGLMNKQTDALRSCLPALAHDGMVLAREFDAYVKSLKKGNFVRRSIKLKS